MIAANDNRAPANAGALPKEKQCSLCETTKPLDEFHAQPTGRYGRHSYCSECANAIRRQSRPSTSSGRGYTQEQTKRWQLKKRYGLSPQDYERMLAEQNSVCAICETPMDRPCVDHNHTTGKVRAILCHGCNIALPYVENDAFRIRAMAYLDKHTDLAA